MPTYISFACFLKNGLCENLTGHLISPQSVPFLFILLQTGDELAELLKRALQIEDGFESVAQWEAYVVTKDHEFRRMIFQMLAESAKHKGMVGDLLKMVNVSDERQIAPLAPARFDFSGKEHLEIMDELYQTEVLMLDTYTLIKESLTGSNIDNILLKGRKEQFLKMLTELISDEGRHALMVSTHQGKMVRIR